MRKKSAKKTKTILVTGAAGFIGSHLCEELIKRRYEVIGYDDLSRGLKDNLRKIQDHPNFQFKYIDISKDDCFRELKKPVFAIVHAASLKIPRYGNRQKTLLANFLTTKNTLELAVRLKAKFVFTSTSDVYGNSSPLPFSEQNNSILGPSKVARWAYAISKLHSEHLVFAYVEDQAVPITIVRVFGTYGPREHRSWWGGAIANFIECILDRKPIPIHGDGCQTRSFCYISDTVAGLIASIEKDDTQGEIINIGNDREISILQLAKTILKFMRLKNYPLEFIAYHSFTGREYQDVLRRRPDLSKASKLLGFRPHVDLEEGLKKTIAWHIRKRMDDKYESKA